MPSHELDRHMRSRENEIETVIEEGAFLVVRLDGRGFTRLTEALGFSKPFDDAFHRHMVETARHLMGCGFPVLYGYTQSDEISLVLDPYHGAFGRRVQKTVSVLAGESSASFSLALGTRAVFEARVLALREPEEVVDYLCWRRSDAVRNARVLHAYWLLRGQGTDPRQATRMLKGMGAREQEALLRDRGGVEFTELPAWQRGGANLWHETFEREGTDPRTGQEKVATRRRVKVEETLPDGAAYPWWIRERIDPPGRDEG